MELTKRHKESLSNVFKSFDKNNIRYVVLRKYGTLPDRIPDNDVDIQVHYDDFEDAINICSTHSFITKHTFISNVSNLIGQAITQPSEAIYWLFNKPKMLFRLVLNTRKPYSKETAGYRSMKLTMNGLILDLKNHLAYRSPMNQARIRVDPYVEKKLYTRRQHAEGFYAPSPPDELAHLICHCIFDKEGNFSPYYVERCNDLVRKIQQTESQRKEFEELLKYLFFGAAELVSNRVFEREYENLRNELYQFDEY